MNLNNNTYTMLSIRHDDKYDSCILTLSSSSCAYCRYCMPVLVSYHTIRQNCFVFVFPRYIYLSFYIMFYSHPYSSPQQHDRIQILFLLIILLLLLLDIFLFNKYKI